MPHPLRRRRLVLDRTQMPLPVGEWSMQKQTSTNGVLIDYSGNGHHGYYGGVARAAILDDVYGGRGLRKGSTAGNYASTPHDTSVAITGDADFQVLLRMLDWTPVSEQIFISKYAGVNGKRSYRFAMDPTGVPMLYWTTNGLVGTRVIVKATAAPTIADDGLLWIRATLDVDNGAGGNTVTFYTGGSGETPVWVQLGDPVVTAGTTSIYDSAGAAQEVGIGAGGVNGVGDDGPLGGTIYRAIIKNGIDGTTVLDVDFTTQAQGTRSFVCATGQTVTVNQSADTAAMPTRLYKVAAGTTIWFPGTSGNTLTVPGLANSTLYNFGITYSDDTTDSSSGTSDGSGVLTIAGTDAKFANKQVKRILESGGGLFDINVPTATLNDTHTSMVIATGQTVTINRSATGLRSTVVNANKEATDGVDDHHSSHDHARLNVTASESLTIAKRVRMYHTPSAEGVLVGKKSGISTAGAGWQLTIDTSRRAVFRVSDGTNVATSTSAALTIGADCLIVGVLDRAMRRVTVYVNGTAAASGDASAVGNLTNTVAVRSGCDGAGANFLAWQGEKEAVFKRALSAAQILRLNSEM